MGFHLGTLLACCLAGLLVLLPWVGEASAGTGAPIRTTAQEPITVEMLRLAVPAVLRDAWLTAENQVWRPWLEQQPAYLGRELYWDPEQEEGQLLIRWRSQQEWKAITEEEVEAVQARFVAAMNQAIPGDSADPVPLVATGRWLLMASETPKTS